MELGSFCLPVEGLVPYQPPMNFYMSMCLEKPIKSSVDSLTYVALNWATFSPNPPSVKRFAIALSTGGASQSLSIPYVQLDLGSNTSIAQVLQYHHDQ